MYEQLITQFTTRKLLRLIKPYVLQNSGSMQDVEDILQDGLVKFIEVFLYMNITMVMPLIILGWITF